MSFAGMLVILGVLAGAAISVVGAVLMLQDDSPGFRDEARAQSAGPLLLQSIPNGVPYAR